MSDAIGSCSDASSTVGRSDAPRAAPSTTTTATRRKKSKKKKTRSLYHQYLADSGNDSSCAEDSDPEDNAFEYEEYVVGMDINVLVQQTVQNIIQSVCLEDYDGLSQFGDHELICFAAAVKHNSSIVSLQIRYLDVSDVSLVPLCAALEKHPSLRALDLSGTRGGDATSRAVCRLVCQNPSVIFAQLDDTVVSPADAVIIQKATRYNAMVCAEVTNNPFHLGLLRNISSIEEKEAKFNEELHAKPWLLAEPPAEEGPQSKKKKKVTIVGGVTRIGAEVCAQYIAGRCLYGSRCKYFHPERTSALKNAVASNQHQRAELLSKFDARSSVASAQSSATRPRLQSRLRPTRFTFRPHDVEDRARAGGATADAAAATLAGVPASPVPPSTLASLWVMAGTVVLCCGVLAAAL